MFELLPMIIFSIATLKSIKLTGSELSSLETGSRIPAIVSAVIKTAGRAITKM